MHDSSVRRAVSFRIRFLDGEPGGPAVIEVDGGGSGELLGRVHRAILRLGMVVVGVERNIDSHGSLRHRLHVEGHSGEPLDQGERDELQWRVLEILADHAANSIQPPAPERIVG